MECVLNIYWYILDADWIYRRRINDLCSEVTKLHCLHITQFVNRVSRIDDARVGSHETIHIRPDFKCIGIKGGCNDTCCVVATSTPQVRHLASGNIGGDETRHKCHFLFLTEVLKLLAHQLIRLVSHEHVLLLLLFSLDEVERVVPHSTFNQRGNDVAGDSFSIADNGIRSLFREVMNEINTLIDTLQIIEKSIHYLQKLNLLVGVGNDGINQLVMPIHHLIVSIDIPWITLQGEFRRVNQLVGHSAQC